MIKTELSVTPINIFQDNYVWMISNGELAIAVDPGDASPVLNWLSQHHLTLLHRKLN